MLRSPARRLVGTIVVLLVAGVAGWWFLLRDDAPEEANLDDAQATIEDEGASGEGASELTSLDRTWSIDPSIGSFDDFSSNYAGYRIDEELANIGAHTAVGRTPDVTGDITIAGGQVTDGSFEIDLTTLHSNDGRRDNQMRGRGLQTDTYPMATFALTEPIDLPASATSGDEIPFSATGDLTLHGVTNHVTIDLRASLTNGIIALVGSAPVTLDDYGIDPPEGFTVVSVADEGELEFQLYLSPA